MRVLSTHANPYHSFRLELVALPALRPDHITVEIQAPAGLTITPLSTVLTGGGASLSYDGSPTTDTELVATVAHT